MFLTEAVVLSTTSILVLALLVLPQMISFGRWKRDRFMPVTTETSEYTSLLGHANPSSPENEKWQVESLGKRGNTRSSYMIVAGLMIVRLCLVMVEMTYRWKKSTSDLTILIPMCLLPILEAFTLTSLFVWVAYPPKNRENIVLIAFEKLYCRSMYFSLTCYFCICVLTHGIQVLRTGYLDRANLTRLTAVFFDLLLLTTCSIMATWISIPKLKRKLVNEREPSHESDAGLYSSWTFSWLNSLIKKGSQQTLTMDDLWEIEEEERMAWSIREHETFKRGRPNVSIGRCMLQLIYGILSLQFVYELMSCFLYFSNPILLNRIIEYIEKKETGPLAIIYMLAMFVCSLLRFGAEGQASLLGRKMGIRVRNILTGLIYQKALKRPANFTGSDDSASMGKIVNLMSVDAGKIGDFLGYAYTPIITLLQIVFCILGLVYLLGWPALIGIGVMILIMVAGAPLANYINNAFNDLMTSRDDRATLMNEVIQGIKIIKFFAWEPQFKAKVDDLRSKELKNLLNVGLLGTANRVLWYSTPIIVSIMTFLIYTKIAGNDLTASTAFTSLALFNMLRMPLQTFPDTIVQLVDTWVSYTRIRGFLTEIELELSPKSHSHRIGFKDASFTWDHTLTNTGMFTLEDLNCELPMNQLSLVIGSTGSGKSSFIMALLGEMKRTNGHRYLPDNVAYASQTAWLSNNTIRDNIVFGQPWDPERYRRVVHACALVRDFETLEGNDMTEVGEKGINLSGGQKQRISLARACYSCASVIIMDDPLSAVDAPTAKHIYENCMLGFLKGRTRILVTNAVNLCLSRADYVVMMDNGRISLQGTCTEFLETLSPENGFTEALCESKPVIEAEMKTIEPVRVPDMEELEKIFGTTLIEFEQHDAINKEKARLVKDEECAQGNVDKNVYKLYYDAIGGHVFLAVLLTGYSLNHGLAIAQDNWVRIWTNAYNLLSIDWLLLYIKSPKVGSVDVDYYLLVYGILGLVTIIAILIRLLILVYGGNYAAKNIHEQLLSRLLKAPMRFYETTPTGRIMNRVTKDVASVDFEVNLASGNTIYSLVYALFVLGMICFVTPTFILALIPIGYIYAKIGLYYIATSRSLKRLDSVSKSPIFSHFSESITGVTTIRAFDEVKQFISENSNRVDDYNRANYLLSVSNYWLSVRIQLVGATIVLVSGIAILFSGVDAGLAGLCLNFSMTLTDTLINLVRLLSLLEMSMNSVERVKEYLDIEQEAESVTQHRPPTSWPNEGLIKIVDLSIAYSPTSAPVLNGVSVVFKPREKIGVVGRTGAGKSTLTLAFYRFMEPLGGTIWIDGIDIRKIGLSDLRSALTIIPQDPILFTGNLRYNLDPFETKDDLTLWKALARAHLVNESKPHSRQSSADTLTDGSFQITLDSPIQEGGTNFSQGQRQLICLARALVRQSKVIILDEATASVDSETDARIQNTIRTEFSDSTVITIAHRLKTIMDYDKVLVLDKGQVAEFGSPKELLNKNGIFNSMCLETGEYDALVAIAK